ncbi:hypothetical protein L208DRAFT_1301494, partial [Tricholoma matsutake]
EQEKAFRIVATHASDPYSEPLWMYIGGMAGTGKSQVLKALKSFFKKRNESQVVAPTGSAAALRTKALTTWGTVLRDKYRVIPQFVHVDKDMAKIGSCQKTWSQAKIQLCWWHLRKAIRTRLQLAKLSMTPYNIKHARGEFGFISTGFQPTSKVDAKECKGGIPSESNVSVDLEGMPTTQGPNSLFI